MSFIFQQIDCQTAGSKSFSGPIGQLLTCYEKLPVVDYEPIDCSIPDIDRNLLSKDQEYLLDISNAITLGHCPEDLSNRDPDPLFHSRWLIAVNRVFRFLIRSVRKLKRNSWLHLKIIHACVVCRKKSKYFTDGPKHVF
ncbi:hypothetical protein AVEN_159916-1 [Araneus ventricosus]|uniref:Uncharacterized protein n=1 Tax=Araneus ventricosus TaxID=182803 RepID=A0A4Y2E5D3_ARAVE|nr:hypothetical protein AVEN_159916-1 [Araneus ventricosus]